jgi:hypothetical protein
MPPPTRADRADRWRLALPLLYATLVFAPMLRNQFWRDDFDWIMRAMDAIQDPSTLLEVSKPHFRPISALSFLLNFTLTGINPVGYYLFNLGLHLCNVALVTALTRRLTGDVRVAMLAGLLFAGGLSNYGEAVIWIAARTGLIADLFSLAALVTHARYLQEGRRRDWVLVVLWTVLALLSKEPAAILVPLLALLEWAIGRPAEGVAPARRRYAILLSTLAAYLLFEFAIYHRGSPVVDRDYAIGWHAARNLVEYLARMVVPLTPSSMMVEVPAPWRPAIGFMHTGLMIAVPLLWVWLMSRPIPRAARFGLLWIVIAILPYLFLTFRTITRYLYLPSVGVAITVAVLAVGALDRRQPAAGRKAAPKWAKMALVGMLLVQAAVVNVAILQRHRMQHAQSSEGQRELEERARAWSLQ